MELYTDLPTVIDKLGWSSEIKRIRDRVLNCSTPHVFGIHGDWGSGKTSFMRQLQRSLGGTMPNDASVDSAGDQLDRAERVKMNKRAVTMWFDSWRYQHEAAPVVALLQEMRKQMSTMSSIKAHFEKVGQIAMYSVLDNLSEIGKTISLDTLPNVEKIEKRGERWEKEKFAEEIGVNSIRDHLCQAIKCLLPGGNSRVIVFIDDLDRCNSKAAMRLLEGLKIYMSIPNCVFILGMNERILVDAIRDELSTPVITSPEEFKLRTEELRLRASHYLEKICTDIYRLPLPTNPLELLKKWIADIEQGQALVMALANISCLPPNPRRLKALANQWHRFASCVQFPADVREQTYWAVRVIVVIYIHQFHRDLWERWHYNPNFWIEIQAFCGGERANPLPDWAKSLKLTYQEVGPGEDEVKTAYPNP
jgi:DNA polymerase III delta prime subunit